MLVLQAPSEIAVIQPTKRQQPTVINSTESCKFSTFRKFCLRLILASSDSDEAEETVERLGFRRTSNITRRRSSVVIRDNPLQMEPQIRNRRESRRSMTVLPTEGRDLQ